jgi:hypothetical protein
MAVSVNIDIPSKLQDENIVKGQINDLITDFPDAVASELQAVMEKVKETAVDLCPKDTGALASSISLESGSISASRQGDFFEANIYAGSPDIINPKTGKATSDYAMLVHDGHMMKDGSMYEGVPFLVEAIMMYESEIEEAVNRALQEQLKDSGD